MLPAPGFGGDGAEVSVIDKIAAMNQQALYTGSKPPLRGVPLMQLPVGTIEPEGWLLKQLQLQADGYTGRLQELSMYLKKSGNAWLDPAGKGHSGWEEVPYWLRGYVPLAYLLNDEDMIAEAHAWIEAILNSSQDGGWFGPESNRTREGGLPDIMSNMFAQFALEDYYDRTGDRRVIEVMTAFCRYLEALPEKQYLTGNWQHKRGGDQLHHIFWLYNRTGEEWLLDLARKTHKRTLAWHDGLKDDHNVNIMQGLREPMTYGLLDKSRDYSRVTNRIYEDVYNRWGQVPGGGFCGDDFIRKGYEDPRQGMEACGMVEMMLSAEILLSITGDMRWADRCENMAFNSLPAMATADMKALRYHTAPNMPVSDNTVKTPEYGWGGWYGLAGTWMNPHAHRCCQHNTGMGWPYFTKHLWYATSDGGLVSVLFAPNSITAKVGGGETVTVRQRTRYPFEETIEYTVETGAPVKFPLYVRIPGWCKSAKIMVNGEPVDADARPRAFFLVLREWNNGDTVTVRFPMDLRVQRWDKNANSASLNYGPLTFSLNIVEKKEITNGMAYQSGEGLHAVCREYNDDVVRFTGTDAWPAFNLMPGSPWNYGLALTEDEPASDFEIIRRTWPENDMPFTREGAPVILRGPAKRIPQWKIGEKNLVNILPVSPATTEAKLETVEFIPMGAARLRITAFPVVE